MADFGITLDDVISELQYEVEEAINFMWSEFEDVWAKAERYYAGGCDLPTDEGRSNAVKTEVRDIIRAAKPNIMRVLYHGRKPVEYIPSHISHAAFIAQQGTYVNQLFTSCGGYRVLSNAVDQALRLKVGPIKTWWEVDPAPKFIHFTGLTSDEVEEIKAQPDIEVIEVEDNPNLGEDQAQVELYDVKARQYLPNGQIFVEDFPVYEFFVSRNATSLEDARVHGHHRTVKVAEAIEMGLEHDDWTELIGTDPEEKYGAQQSRARRGYQTDADEDDSDDITQKEILLTEVYCKYDLDGDGREERYCFYLGGTHYTYLSHHEIEDYCIDLVCADPQPGTVIGRSLADLTIEMQDNETSILRAIIDNAHMANNPRMAGDPNNVDFDDIMNNAIGAPIKTRGAPNIQVADVPFTGASLIPFLEYLEQDTEQRVGITKAATGLDPDALQSTNKDAVLNTIQLSQGQVELMARNVVETGLVGVFKKLLRLSIRHMDRIQVMRTKGVILPVDVTMFDPNLAAEPNVGLGNASHEEKLQTLNFILQKQEQILAQFGMDNPFTNLSQVYNTLEDIVELGGMRDPGRYFQVVTPQMEAQIAQSRAEQARQQAENAPPPPMDPSVALLQSENVKAAVRKLEVISDARQKELELQFKAEQAAEENDLKRDTMLQERMIELKKMGEERLNSLIERKQEANNKDADTTGSPRPSRSSQKAS